MFSHNPSFRGWFSNDFQAMTFLFEVVVGAPLDHGVNENLTREERWNIIWAAPWRRWRLIKPEQGFNGI